MESSKIGKTPGDPSISACMIVKNEEVFLPQCLDSIKDVVDELIIVDTGSTDRTVEIAENYGAKIYHHPWQGSFSEARNHSIKYATCDWILQIDADEKLEEKDINILRGAVRLKQYNSLFVSLVSEMPTGLSMNYFQRLYRRGTAHYEGIVHNQVVCEGAALLTNIRIHHYGYNLDPEKMEKKHKRTQDLLIKQVAENPDFMFARANLVRIYRCQMLWDEAIKSAEEALQLEILQNELIPHQMILCDMTYSLLMKKDHDEAMSVCAKLLKINPDNLDGNFYMGGLYICQEKYQKALRHYKKYLKQSEVQGTGDEYTALIMDTFGSQHQAWNNMGTCYNRLEQHDDAAMAFRKAISYEPNEPMYHENLARCLIRQGKTDEAIPVLENAVKQDIASSPIYHQLGDMYYSHNKIKQAIELLEKAIQIDENNIGPRVALGELFVLRGRYEEAEAVLNEAMELNPNIFEILSNLALINAKLDREEESTEYIGRAIELVGTNSDKYMKMADKWVEMEEYGGAILFYEQCLQLDPKNKIALTNISTCYARLGEYDSAFTGYRAVLEMSPEDPVVIRNLMAMQQAINNIIAPK